MRARSCATSMRNVANMYRGKWFQVAKRNVANVFITLFVRQTVVIFTALKLVINWNFVVGFLEEIKGNAYKRMH